MKKQSRLDVRKFSLSQRTINVWNKYYQQSRYMLVVEEEETLFVNGIVTVGAV